MSHHACSLITLCLNLFQNFNNDTLSLGVSYLYMIIVQLYSLTLQQKLHYFGIDNLMDLFCYVTSLLVFSITLIFLENASFVQVVWDFSDCEGSTGIRSSWQWQLVLPISSLFNATKSDEECWRVFP